MGNLKDAILYGYYDEQKNYIVEVDTPLLQEIINQQYPDYKNFLTHMETKIKLYDLLKFEYTNGLSPEYNEFVLKLERMDE